MQPRPVVRWEVDSFLDLPHRLDFHLDLPLLLHLLQSGCRDRHSRVDETLPARLELLQVLGDERVAGFLQSRRLRLGCFGPVELLERLLLLLEDALDITLPLVCVAEEVRKVHSGLHASAEVDALGVVEGLQRLDAFAGVVQ